MLAKEARRKHLWHPLNWPSWIAIAILYPFAFLPLSINIILGRCLGRICYYLLPSRRNIATRNLALCFPSWSEKARTHLLKKHFAELGIGLLESNMAWWRNPKRLKHYCTLTGFEHLEQIKQSGHGALIIGGHFTNLDIFGSLATNFIAFTVTMRRLKNPVFDFIFKRFRYKHFGKTLDRKELKGMIKSLRTGEFLWYAPDQDYGPDNSIFVPFFGVPAASLKITPKLIKLTQAKILTVTHFRHRNRYELIIKPFKYDTIPSHDLAYDVRCINKEIETMILQCPEQYLWIHRRFKTGPDGDSNIYRDDAAFEKTLSSRLANEHHLFQNDSLMTEIEHRVKRNILEVEDVEV